MGLYNYFFGSVSFIVECSNPERFINSLRQKIAIRNLTRLSQTQIGLECSFSEHTKLEKAVNEFGASIHKKTCKGFLPFASRYKKRYGMFLGIILCVFIIWFCSNLVWEIRIEGNEKISDDDIKTRLETLGFKEGVFKRTVDLDRLHIDYLMSDNRISWIAVNFQGTIAHVEVKETIKAPEKLDKQKLVNIVAKTDGVIVRVDALDGGKEVSIGQVVSKGDLLISAFMETRKSGVVLRSARGSVFAKTIRNLEVRVPLSVMQKKYTGKIKKQTAFYILGKRISVINFGKNNFEYQDTSKKNKQLTLFEKIVFPVRIETKFKSEYKPEIVDRTADEAKIIAKKTLEEKLKKELPKAQILSQQIKYTTQENQLVLECQVECIEDIAKELEFEMIQ